jgi:hypothetical protein
MSAITTEEPVTFSRISGFYDCFVEVNQVNDSYQEAG